MSKEIERYNYIIMSTKVKELNNLMKSFFKYCEEENTSEMFLRLNKNNDDNIENNSKNNQKKIHNIERFINNENNFDSIISEWSSIDLKMLDILIDSFEIDIEKFLDKLNVSKIDKEIKSFFEDR